MKKYIFILFTVIFSLHISSCSDMLDSIQPYLDKGETIYVGKVDSLSARSGKNRILLEGLYLYGLTQKKCVISWSTPSGEQQSLEMEVERQNPVDKFEALIENLEEGQYEFSVKTYDAKGNSSIASRIDGYSYGVVYESNLINRAIEKIEQQDNGILISWKAINSATFCELIYINTSGAEKNIQIPITEMETQIDDCDITQPIRWRTAYLPQETAIDYFYTEYAEQTIK